MALTHPSWTVDTTFSGKDISSAASVYAFTAGAAAKVQFIVKATVAGNGDYIVYLTHQWLGTGTAAVVLPKTTAAAASGETVIEFVSLEIAVKATDVVNVMIDGLAGDTNVSGAIRISADNPSVFDAANDVPAVNVTTWDGGALPTIPSVDDIWQDIYSGMSHEQAVYNAGLGGSQLTNMVEGGGDFDYQYKAYALENAPSGGLTAQETRDAMKLAPTAGDPAAGSVDAHLDDLAVDVAACGSIIANNTDATAAGSITRRRGNSWSISLTLGDITGWTSLWFTIKSNDDDIDTAAILQVKLNATGLLDGLLYVNGAAATNDALASITVSNAGTGAIVVAVDETITDDLTPGEYVYDAQALIAGNVSTPDSGTFTVTSDVTRSVV